MIITKYEIEAAKKEAAAEAEQLEYLQRVISDNVALTEQNKQLTNEVAALKHALKEWQSVQEGKADKFTRYAPIVNGVDDLPNY